jgi:ABC-type bacteriocin/lantibiotic exporter with double-glycine peptidase domain
LALISVVVFLLDLVPLELQRRIVNDAIHNRTFSLLIWLSAIYGVVVLLQGIGKLAMNIYRNSIGEATSRRLRLDTYEAALHHPDRGSSDKEGLGVSIILSEADPVGSFVSTSISEPVLHGGILISVFTYLLFLQPWMALIGLGLFVPQVIFVPMMQKSINDRTKARIEALRELSINVVNETAEGIEERSPEMYRDRANDVYRLNMEIYRRKFAMNFVMNLLFHLGIVSVLFVGGWLVMQSRIEVGTVVAFISGLHKINDPWGDLVTFFRDMTNARVKYQLIASVLDQRDPAEALEAPVS